MQVLVISVCPNSKIKIGQINREQYQVVLFRRTTHYPSRFTFHQMLPPNLHRSGMSTDFFRRRLDRQISSRQTAHRARQIVHGCVSA